jgi:hypothetical protein
VEFEEIEMTQFTWSIQNIERGHDDYVTISHWRCDGVMGEHSVSCYGTVNFNQEPEEEIIPASGLNEELVLGWTYEKLNKEEVEAAVQAKLDELANPPLISGLPW